jgi:hypothetical protein
LKFYQLIISSESTFHLLVPTYLQKLDQIRSSEAVGVIYHKRDQLHKTSAATCLKYFTWQSCYLYLNQIMGQVKTILTLRVLCIRSNAMLEKFVRIPMINFYKKMPFRVIHGTI